MRSGQQSPQVDEQSPRLPLVKPRGAAAEWCRVTGRGADGGLCPAPGSPYLGAMRAHRLFLPIPLVACLATPVFGHPHIFVDAGFQLIRDTGGRVVAVEVTWRYDELYSLLLAEDFGLDPDYDLQLTEAEVRDTLGFDLNWSGGFEGGLVLRQEGGALEVGPPEPVSLTMLETGQLQTTHRRPVSGAEAGGMIEAQIYDPEFYIAFEMILEVGVADAPECEAELIRADLDAAYAVLEAALEEIGGVVAAEDNFPPVGAHFADRVVVACPG
jgi:ABC-type uncharacterized transport system substrate-binding protein